MLRLTDAGLARELYLQIAEGENNFADLAAVHAQGPEKATRGIVGPVSLTKAHPMLADRLRTASPGALLEPFPIENWWIVVRLENLTPAVFDAPTATQMAEELFEQWLSEQEERQLSELRALLESVSLSNRHKGNQQPDDRHQTSDIRLGHKATDNRHKDNRE